MSYRYNIYFSEEPEGGFTVEVPALPGCITYGENTEKAIDMAKEAVALCVEDLIERGAPIPEDSYSSADNHNLAVAPFSRTPMC